VPRCGRRVHLTGQRRRTSRNDPFSTAADSRKRAGLASGESSTAAAATTLRCAIDLTALVGRLSNLWLVCAVRERMRTLVCERGYTQVSHARYQPLQLISELVQPT